MREAHKECKYTWGKEKYGFDKNAELIIYKCTCGEKLTRKQIKELKESGLNFDLYSSWKNYVYRKYAEMQPNVLGEFCRYLQHGERMAENKRAPLRQVFDALSEGLVAALVGILTLIVPLSGVLIEILENAEKWNIKDLAKIAIMVILLIVVFMTIVKFIINNSVSEAEIEKNFYYDYREIIQELYREKTK